MSPIEEVHQRVLTEIPQLSCKQGVHLLRLVTYLWIFKDVATNCTVENWTDSLKPIIFLAIILYAVWNLSAHSSENKTLMAGSSNEFSSVNVVSCNSSNELTQHLLCASKDKIKWFGEFESLKEFLSKNLNLQGKWSSPGGKCKLLQTKEISIRWYSDRKSLNINGVGENVKRIKTELLSMAKTANDIELNSEVESQDESDEMNTHVPTLPEANIQVQNLPETCDEEDNIVCNDCRKLSIDVAEVKFELALVWAKINALDQKPCQCESLKRENNLLRKSNAFNQN